jgi:hypothetical protein
MRCFCKLWILLPRSSPPPLEEHFASQTGGSQLGYFPVEARRSNSRLAMQIANARETNIS